VFVCFFPGDAFLRRVAYSTDSSSPPPRLNPLVDRRSVDLTLVEIVLCDL